MLATVVAFALSSVPRAAEAFSRVQLCDADPSKQPPTLPGVPGCKGADLVIRSDGSLDVANTSSFDSICLEIDSSGARGKWPDGNRVAMCWNDPRHSDLQCRILTPGLRHEIAIDVPGGVAETVLFDPARVTPDEPITPLFRGPLPFGKGPRLFWNAVEPVVSLDSAFRQGDRLTVLVYNARVDSKAKLQITKGDAVASTSSLAALVNGLKLFTSLIPRMNAFDAEAQAQCQRPSENTFAPSSPGGFTTLSTVVSLEGGYHYQGTLIPQDGGDHHAAPPADGKSTCCCCAGDKDKSDGGAAKAPTSTLSFTTRAKHRTVSLAAEAAFDFDGGRPALAGYSFAPLAQTGPDQLYRLRANSTGIVDRLMTSLLVVFYPLAIANRSEWADGFGLGFGPTILHGSSAEFAKQWNIRAMYEFPFAPGFLISTGVSVRGIDEPVEPASGSVVAVARPGGPPSFTSKSTDTPFFSVGLAVDLALITNAASDAASAVTGSSKKGGQN